MIIRLAFKVLAFALLALAVTPWVWQLTTGDYFMKVTGTSMEPTYRVGDTLVVQKPTGHDLTRVGQIVVVSFEPGDQLHQYVHRVHTVDARGALLQGDNNADVDPGYVTEDLVMGTPRLHLAGAVSEAYQLSQTWPIRLLAAAVIIPGLAIRIRPTRASGDDPRTARGQAATSPQSGTDGSSDEDFNRLLGIEDAAPTTKEELA